MNVNNIKKEDLKEIGERLHKIITIIKKKEGLLYSGNKSSMLGKNAIKEIDFIHTEDSPEMVHILYHNKVGELVKHKASQFYLSKKMATHLIDMVYDHLKELNDDNEVDIFFMNSVSKNMRAVFISADYQDKITKKAESFIEKLPVYSYEDSFIDSINLFEEIIKMIEE